MARVARGDPEAQRLVVGRLLRRVERICRSLLRNSVDALDARQLSLIAILQSARSFRGDSTLERWADRITARTALRAAASERRARQAPGDADQQRSSDPMGESAVLARECLTHISDRQRTVLILRHGLEYSIEEIAEISGISVNSVKDRLLRGRAIARRMARREQLLVEVATRRAAAKPRG